MASLPPGGETPPVTACLPCYFLPSRAPIPIPPSGGNLPLKRYGATAVKFRGNICHLHQDRIDEVKVQRTTQGFINRTETCHNAFGFFNGVNTVYYIYIVFHVYFCVSCLSQREQLEGYSVERIPPPCNA